MQIFVKLQGRTLTLDVETQDTIEQVKQKLAGKAGGSAADYNLSYSSRPLKDTNSVSEYNIQKESTLEAFRKLPPPDYDPHVKEVLLNDLRILGQEESQLVFIGLGSYDNGHGDASIKRQQCPDGLLHLCRHLKWNLTILLIDPGFETPVQKSQSRQIYHVDPNWQLVFEQGKVRRFRYNDPFAKFFVWTYGTTILPAEYGGESLTLAGMNLVDVLGPAIADRGGALVVGNLYSEKLPPHLFVGPSQHSLPVLQVFGHDSASTCRLGVLRLQGG